MTGFQHDIAGGGGGLVIPSLHSPNYVPGVSGWAIFKNGSVEFNSGTFRGTVTAGKFQGADIIIDSSGMFLYQPNTTPGLGNKPLLSICYANQDPFGNAVNTGFAAYVGNGNITVDAGKVTFFPSGAFGSGNITPIGTHELDYTAPMAANTDNQASLVMLSQPAGTPAQIVTSGLAAIAPGGGISVAETWHAVTLGTGLTGNIRVKLLPLYNMAMLDICISWTTTAASSIACGSLPSAAYYPTVFGASGGTRQYDLGNNATPTSAVAPVRVDIGPSGALTINLPATSAGATKCAGSIMYPLD